MGLAVVAHRGRHNRRRTHECGDRAAFDLMVNMGLTIMVLDKNLPLAVATVIKDRNVKTVIVTTMLVFAHSWQRADWRSDAGSCNCCGCAWSGSKYHSMFLSHTKASRRRRRGLACEANEDQCWTVTHTQQSPRECPKSLKWDNGIKGIVQLAIGSRPSSSSSSARSQMPARSCSATCGALRLPRYVDKTSQKFAHAEPNKRQRLLLNSEALAQQQTCDKIFVDSCTGTCIICAQILSERAPTIRLNPEVLA